MNLKEKIQKLIKNFLENTTNPSTLGSGSKFVKENKQDIISLTNFLPENSNTNERLYIIYHNITEDDIKCPMCSKNKKFYTFPRGYNLTCSQSCATKYQQKFLVDKTQLYEKRRQTYSKKTKEETKAISEKGIGTKKEKYGENALSIIAKRGYQTYKSKDNFKCISEYTKEIRENDPEKWKNYHNKAANTMKNDIDENGNNHYDRIHLLKLNDIDENGNNFYDRIHLLKLNDIDENGNNFYDRQHLTMVERGHWTSPEDKEDFEHYNQKVWKLTRKQDIHLLENIEKRGHANKGLYHLDHMFSIFEGFKQNIPVYLIGNINNLRMIKGRNNIAKGKKCDIPLDKLFNLVRKDYKLNYDKRFND